MDNSTGIVIAVLLGATFSMVAGILPVLHRIETLLSEIRDNTKKKATNPWGSGT